MPLIYPILDFDFIKKNNLCFKQILEMWQECPLIEFIQLRGKSLNSNQVSDFYCRIMSKFPKLRIVINDNWKLAIQLNAFGFHLGKEDFQNLSVKDKKIIENSPLFKGTSSHSLEDLENLENFWNYTGFGPIFQTQSKKSNYPTIGLDQLHKISNKFKTKIFLIGGINNENLKAILKINDFKIASISYLSYKENLKKTLEIYNARKYRISDK